LSSEKAWEALVQSQVRFNRIPEKFRRRFRNRVPEKVPEKAPQEALMQAKSGSTGFRRRF